MHVQQLMGIGHQRRAAAIARVLQRRGAEVTYVSGGASVPDLDVGGALFVQLPPARAADSTYRALIDERGAVVDESWKRKRAGLLLDTLEATEPHALLTETFPFGRRLLGFELQPLLERAHSMRPRPVSLCSIRDIVEPRSNPQRYRQMAELVQRYFDWVLVHSDCEVTPFEASFPLTKSIADKIRYTGYVVERGPPVADPRTGEREVIISAGGGRVGDRLLRAAMQAKAHSSLEAQRWRILVGPDVAAETYRALGEQAPAGVIVQRNRPDFGALLERCLVSVSQGGYNTVVDLLRARARAVIVPFAAGGEREQTMRAELLADRALARVVSCEALGPQSLARAIDEAGASPRPDPGAIDLNGLERTADLIFAEVRSPSPRPTAPI